MTAQTKAPDASDGREALFPEKESDDRSSPASRQFVGVLGLTLPLFLWLISGLRPTEGLSRWRLLDSLSAYYYTGSVVVFVGILVTLAVSLIAYQGYANENQKLDRRAAIVAGTAALFVAFFPSRAPNCMALPSWWAPWTGRIHYLSAAVLFGSFGFFTLCLFRKSKIQGGEKLPLDKQARNAFYLLCGIAIAGSMVWAGSTYFTSASIFWPEVLALEFFAASWLVKGRLDRTAAALGRRTLRYGRHPKRLVRDIRGALGGQRGAPRASRQ